AALTSKSLNDITKVVGDRVMVPLDSEPLAVVTTTSHVPSRPPLPIGPPPLDEDAASDPHEQAKTEIATDTNDLESERSVVITTPRSGRFGPSSAPACTRMPARIPEGSRAAR